MSQNNFAFAVAQVRALENQLLNKSGYEQILSAKTENEIFDILSARGYVIPENADGTEQVLKLEQQRVWELLSGLADNVPELRLFTVKNDYHNLKTVLKAFFCEAEQTENLLYPSTVPYETLCLAVTEKKYDLLPALMEQALTEAYAALAESGDGQTADVIIDRYTLLEYKALIGKTESNIVKEICTLTVEYSDIKTAYRGSKTRKGEEFYKKALCGTDNLSEKQLSRVARKGKDELLSFLSDSGFGEAAQALSVSVFELEKLFEDKIFAALKNAEFTSFGAEPLIAYGYKKENEIKNIRIAVTCKNMGADVKSTEERMRISDV